MDAHLKPRPYDLANPEERKRLVREVGGYLRTCEQNHHGTDFMGREYAMEALPLLLGVFDSRVTELLEANNREVERRRKIESTLMPHNWHPKDAIKTVADIPDAELLGRAVRTARPAADRKGSKGMRWVGVMSAFSLGSTFAYQLCRRFGLDPDEVVKK